VTDARLEELFRAFERRLAAIERRHADEDAAREAAADRERRQQLRDEIAARRQRHWLELTDVEQAARWGREVDRAVKGYRRRQAG
jgi:hypothetical protein